MLRQRCLSLIVLSGFIALSLFCKTAQAADENPREPHEFQVAMYEGAKLLAANEQAKALARFRQALKLNPESASAYYWTGLVYNDMLNYGLAASNAAKAALLDENMSDAWLLWGQSLLYMKREKDAREKLEKAFVLSPHNHLIPYNLGLCYFYGLDNKRKAREYFRKARELDSRFVPAAFYEGCCYLALDIAPVAISTFKAVLKVDPTHAEARFRLGIAYIQDGQYVEAAKTLRDLLTQVPEHYEAHLQLWQLYSTDLPDKDQAKIHLQRFLQYAPASHPYRAQAERTLEGR